MIRDRVWQVNIEGHGKLQDLVVEGGKVGEGSLIGNLVIVNWYFLLAERTAINPILRRCRCGLTKATFAAEPSYTTSGW
jgi:hypothetical protein